MLPNTAQNINLASLTFWSNYWGVLYNYVDGVQFGVQLKVKSLIINEKIPYN
jgi:hypothetical protein